MTFRSTSELVLVYHDAFHKGKKEAVRQLLLGDGEFTGPLNSYHDADKFLEGSAIFMRLSKNSAVRQVVADGDHVCIIYDYRTIVPSIPVIPIVSWFQVESGKIKLFHTFFNPCPFLRAKENEDVEKALKSVK